MARGRARRGRQHGVGGVRGRPTTRSSSRLAAAEAINTGGGEASGSVEQSVSSAMASASPSQPEPSGDQNRTDSRSSAAAGSASSSSNGNNEKAGSSKKQLTRAEEIQLEADRIPSVKTSTWNPFTVFPEEIWGIIFDSITDSKDKENFINATPEWRQMCLPKMAAVIFPLALPILLENQKDQLHQDDDYLRDEEVYLEWRLVCKFWDQAVQNFIQWHPAHFKMVLKAEYFGMRGPKNLIDYDEQNWQENTLGFIGDREEYGQISFDEMAKTPPPANDRNPFLSRQLGFTDEHMIMITLGGGGMWWREEGGVRPAPRPVQQPNIAHSEEKWSKVNDVLERYGRHVWDCSLNFQYNLTPLTWYTKIQHWISLMENLKVLKLEYSIKENRSNANSQRRQRNALGNHIATSPFTELKDLIVLKTEDMPGPVFNELISKATNLQKLQARFRGDGTGTRLSDYQFNMMASQNLTECYLTLLCAEDFTHLESTGGSWPLKKLFLELNYENDDEETKSYPTWPQWDRTFKFIGEKFGATLLELKLELPKATSPEDKQRIVDESPNYRLNLPHAKSVRVVVPNLTSFDFLLPMKSLEQLCIVVDHLESYGKNTNLKEKDILKFTGNFHRLFKTNVWEKMSKLKFIKLYILQRPSPMDCGRGLQWYTMHDYDKEIMKHTHSRMAPSTD